MNDAKSLGHHLNQINEATLDACSFVDGMIKADFLADKRTQKAVVMSLLIIGEAATKVMDRYGDFAREHAAIPWRSMRGMRNRIAHSYFEVDLETV